MKSLKSIVYSNLRRLAVVMVVVILIVTVVLQILSLQNQARENADATFLQVRQVLDQNKIELETIEAEYRETCLLNAETISYVIQLNPDILGDVEEFRKLAYRMEVDEIHIFDDTGRIFTGTHPEYFNFTFDSGEQMNFFKPMMEDKSLRLCQDITPNTAEGKMVQYSALWDSNGQFIVQVGMYPDAVLETTEKNELSYIFSLLQGNPGVSLYAIDLESGKVVGSTSGTENGKEMEQIGFQRSDVELCPKGIHLTISGVDSYGIFERMDNTVIGYIISNDSLYHNVFSSALTLTICLLGIAVVLVLVVQKFTDTYIIGSIDTINEKLRVVSDGNLEERVDVQSNVEFSELSNHINHMIQNLLAGTEKIGFVLNQTNLRIGVYEYNTKMKNVRFTEHIPEIFDLSRSEVQRLTEDYHHLQTFVDCLRSEPVADMEHTYRLQGANKRYIKLEEIHNESDDVLGVVLDVTEDTINLKRAEKERDFDLLTGLFNRRGLERQMQKLFAAETELGGCALIVVDSDNMKGVNDSYGHRVGDLYLQRHADLFKTFCSPNCCAARVGGDEFVLFVYGFRNEDALREALNQLRSWQDREYLTLEDGTKVLLRFSFGYQYTEEKADYDTLFSSADEYMYNSKRVRKKLAEEQNDTDILL